MSYGIAQHTISYLRTVHSTISRNLSGSAEKSIVEKPSRDEHIQHAHSLFHNNRKNWTRYDTSHAAIQCRRDIKPASI